MAFDLRRLSIIEVAAIAIILLSVAMIAFVGFSMGRTMKAGCAKASAIRS